MQDIYGNPIKQTTANCYVVSKTGRYKFPMVFGNAIKNGEINSAAYTKIEGSYCKSFVDFYGDTISTPYIEEQLHEVEWSGVAITNTDTDDVVGSVGMIAEDICKYIQIDIKSVPTTGANVLVSIVTPNGEAVWTWHIWVWPHDLTPVEITNSTGVKYKIMPVNLATKLDNGTEYGSGTVGYKNWFYQWGRPTPLLCPASYKDSAYGDLGNISFTLDKASYYEDGIRYPLIHYASKSSPYNWFGTSSYYNLWDSACNKVGNSDNEVIKTIYDPCPVGWKIPNGNTFTYFSTSNVVGSFSNGWKFKRYAGDTKGVFFPATGSVHYNSQKLDKVGTDGFIWLSSSSSRTTANLLNFTSSRVAAQHKLYRAYGLSVRPVQE